MSARDELRQATRRYRRTKKAYEEATEDVTNLVVKALREGERPTDVIDDSPFTGPYVRRIARKNGIEPRKKGETPA